MADGRDAVAGEDLSDADLAEIDREARESLTRRAIPSDRLLGITLVVGAAISLTMAVLLFQGGRELARNPDARLSCDVNPFISCGSVMQTPQAHAFGIPNIWIGLVGYPIVLVVGLLLVAGIRLPRFVRLGTLAGLAFATLFVTYLASQAIWVIHILCPDCMGVWVSTLPMFTLHLAHSAGHGDLRVGERARRVLVSGRWWFAIAWIALVALSILISFRGNWLQMAGL